MRPFSAENKTRWLVDLWLSPYRWSCRSVRSACLFHVPSSSPCLWGWRWSRPPPPGFPPSHPLAHHWSPCSTKPRLLKRRSAVSELGDPFEAPPLDVRARRRGGGPPGGGLGGLSVASAWRLPGHHLWAVAIIFPLQPSSAPGFFVTLVVFKRCDSVNKYKPHLCAKTSGNATQTGSLKHTLLSGWAISTRC